MEKSHIQEIKGIALATIALLIFLSLISYDQADVPWLISTPDAPPHNWVSRVGVHVSSALIFLFGMGSYAVVGFLIFLSWLAFTHRPLRLSLPKLIAVWVLFTVVAAFLALGRGISPEIRFSRGGLLGYSVADFFLRYLGTTGTVVVLSSFGAISLVLSGEVLISEYVRRGLEHASRRPQKVWDGLKRRPGFGWLRRRRPRTTSPFDLVLRKKHGEKPSVWSDIVRRLSRTSGDKKKDDFEKIGPAAGQLTKHETDVKLTRRPTIRITESHASSSQAPPHPGRHPTRKKEGKTEGVTPASAGATGYRLPSFDLLLDPPAFSHRQIESDLAHGIQTLETTLSSFNVAARVADVERGPVITRYEIEPAPGVKINKITALADDIALAMKVAAVRIVAPIPGKNRVGVEVPNSATAAVYLKDVLKDARVQQDKKGALMLALGKDISGRSIVADLAEMPHLLIAGTTGSGKTVCVNSLIMSLLFKATPEEVKFIMVDPKMVELVQYNPLPHMICPTITDHKKAAAALNWLVSEMEQRYRTLSQAGARNIQAYRRGGGTMPYIIVIIDELADLMQTSAKTVESAITRLAQLSRAVGIHLILATQRPSVNVITGVIKANFPARLSFKVASKVDSRTVLDMNGAESLLGKGDMLFLKPGEAKPIRGQCSFVNDEEVRAVIDYLRSQAEPRYDESIFTKTASAGSGGNDERDELYDEAVRVVIETNQASVSILQRRLRLGYTRAARLIDMMEQDGIVGPYCGSKAREILVDREQWLLNRMKTESSSEEDSSRPADESLMESS